MAAGLLFWGHCTGGVTQRLWALVQGVCQNLTPALSLTMFMLFTTGGYTHTHTHWQHYTSVPARHCEHVHINSLEHSVSLIVRVCCVCVSVCLPACLSGEARFPCGNSANLAGKDNTAVKLSLSLSLSLSWGEGEGNQRIIWIVNPKDESSRGQVNEATLTFKTRCLGPSAPLAFYPGQSLSLSLSLSLKTNARQAG